MKTICSYLFLLTIISCNQTFVKSQIIENNKMQNKSTVTSYVIGSETRMTYESTRTGEDGACKFNGYFSSKTQPETRINIGLRFEKSGNTIKDTLETQLFSKFMNLKDVKMVRIDSLEFKVNDNQIKLKFIISLTRDENDKHKTIDKYWMVYSSGFKNSMPDLVVDKIEKSSVDILGNTY